MGLRFVGLLAVLPLLLRSVPAEQMGVYYVIFSLMGLLAMVDLGISVSFTRAMGYAWAGARSIKSTGVEDISQLSVKPHWDLVSDLFETMRWFFQRTVFFGYILLGAGGCMYMLYIRPSSMSVSTILLLWLSYLTFACVNYVSNVWVILLQAGNNVRDHQMFFGISIAAGYIFSIGGLLLGFGLWAMCASFAIQSLVMRVCCELRCRNGFARQLFLHRGVFRKDYFSAIWPNSWRFGLAQGAGSFTTSLPVLISSYVIGLGESASVGVTVQVVVAITQIAGIGFQVKVPLFNILRASGDIARLKAVFIQRLLLYIYLCIIIGSGFVLIGPWLFSHVIKTKTPLLAGCALILSLLFISLEGVQASFQRLLVSNNTVPFWKRSIVLTLTLAVIGSVSAGAAGVSGLLASLIVWKLLYFDVRMYADGIITLELRKADFCALIIDFHTNLWKNSLSLLRSK